MQYLEDNQVKWKVKKFGGVGLPVGFEYISMNPNIQEGSLPLLGGIYSRATYKDLWAWVQTQDGYCISESDWQNKFAANNGNVPFYSTGDGSTTFRVPSVSCWVKGASGISEVGSYLEAGLPNITGTLALDRVGYSASSAVYATGALYANYEDNLPNNGAANYVETQHPKTFGIDASRSNAIYGNSDTVQPQSIVGMWMVKAYGTVTNSGNVDVSNLAAEVSAMQTIKANKGSLSTPSSKTITVSPTWETSDTVPTYRTMFIYAAPADGWAVYIGKASGVDNSNGFMEGKHNPSGIHFYAGSELKGYVTVAVPCSAGDTITIYKETDVTDINFRFLYAKSEVDA